MSYSTDYDQFPWIYVTQPCCNCSDYWPNTQLPVQMLVLDCQRHNGTIVISERNCKWEMTLDVLYKGLKVVLVPNKGKKGWKHAKKKLVSIPPRSVFMQITDASQSYFAIANCIQETYINRSDSEMTKVCAVAKVNPPNTS